MALDGRVAVVTGGGRGIGRAVALALAEDGADVAINYRRDEEAATDTVAEIEKLGRRAEKYHASVDSWAEDEAMVAAILADFGGVDILVNNAGIASRGNSVVNTDPAEFERVWRIHTFGAFALSKLVIPSMRERDRGDIVMMSSVATVNLAGWSSPYNVAKAGLEALARTLARPSITSAHPRRWPTWCASSSPTPPDTSQTRSSPSTAAASEALFRR